MALPSPPDRGCSRRGFLAGVAGMLALSGCKAGKSRPDILMVTLCSARADRVGALGYTGRATTPVIDTLAARGVAFRRAWANATWTNPAHATILTGLLPGHHRLYDDNDVLVPGAPTLPGLLAEAGYRTGALLQERGQMSLDARSDVLRDVDEVLEATDLASWSPDGFARWAAADPAPFFGLVHLREAHLPFGDGRPFVEPAALAPALRTWREGVGRPGIPGPVVWDEPVDPHRWLAMQMEADPALQAELDAVYDSGLHDADASVGRLLAALDAAGRLADTIVVIVGDHGDRLVGHKGVLERSVVNVPLVIALPDRRGAGTVVSSHVGQFDLQPTLLELAGVPPPAIQDGVSLVPALSGQALPDRAILTQSLHQVAGRLERREAIVRGELRLVQRTDDRFDIERGHDNVVFDKARSPDADALYAELGRLGGDTYVPTKVTPVTPEVQDAMRRQGYW